jgi:hypothetical protein
MVYHVCNDCDFANENKSTVSRHCASKGHTFSSSKKLPPNSAGRQMIINNNHGDNNFFINGDHNIIQNFTVNNILPYNSDSHVENLVQRGDMMARCLDDISLAAGNTIWELMFDPNNPYGWSVHIPNSKQNKIHLIEENGIVNEYPLAEGLDKVLRFGAECVDTLMMGYDNELTKQDIKKNRIYLRRKIIDQDSTRDKRSKIFKGALEG